ncbi:unnamed protein product [Coregonus sp. 'balchen']|nr:unnamed protein product [Coregonus sp. 'balchen']
MWTSLHGFWLQIGDGPLIVSGDARCDSPGHGASFDTYTDLDSASHLILAQETGHVTEVKNSYWLETEGLERRLQHVEDHGCSIETLATDRHPSVRLYFRDSHADIWHENDLWHIAKGVRKQLVAIGKPVRTPLSAERETVAVTLGERAGVPKMEKEQAIQQRIQRYTRP